MVAIVSQENMVSRTGRHLQRYSKGRRQVVGCIPYRYKNSKESPSEDELEVLAITSQKGKGVLFPKGGWELDETKEGAAARETMEEAGVRGTIESELGKWSFKSKSHDAYYEGYMFPLHVNEQLEFWPEKNLRQRKWMSVQQARDVCQHWWMKEALDRLERSAADRQMCNLRQRKWMSVQQARDVCQHWWMKEALDRLVSRLSSQQQQHEDQEFGPVLKSMRANL